LQHFTFPEPAAIVRLGMDPVWAHCARLRLTLLLALRLLLLRGKGQISEPLEGDLHKLS